MTLSSVRRLSDDALRRDLRDLVAHDRITTVRLLIHMAEFQARRLYRQDGYPSMHEYCLRELGMSEDVAYKRVRTARMARRYPRILSALVEGRLTLSAVALLTPHLTDRTAEDLLTEAERKTNQQVAELIARRFPKSDLPTMVQPVFAAQELAVRPILDRFGQSDTPMGQPMAQPLESAWRPTVNPLAPERYGVQFTIGREDRELLQRAKDLMSHQIPSGDEGEVFVHALRAFVQQLEKRKYGATDQPRKGSQESENPRYVPAHVRRAVRQRDQDRCTFVAHNGHRCEARRHLEFDHVLEVARGGKSTIENVRLRCGAHNQFTAEQTFGRDFMKAKIEASRAEARKRAEEIAPWLQALGIRADQARYAAAQCAEMPGATLEERVKATLRHFGPRDVALRAAAPA